MRRPAAHLQWRRQEKERDDLEHKKRNEPDQTEKIDRRIREVCSAIAATGKANTIKNVMTLARGMLLLPHGKEFAGPETDLYLNCRNGVLDLSTWPPKLIKHADAKHLLITHLIDVDYDPEADCPLWKSFLSDAQGGKQEVIDFLARLAGLWLTGKPHKSFVLFQGPGDSGKSVFTGVFLDLLKKEELAVRLNKEAFEKHKHSTSQADLISKRFAVLPELDRDFEFPAGQIKSLTGDDGINAHKMRADNKQARQTWHLAMTCNRRPNLDASDTALWNRLILMPFKITCPKEKQDRGLRDKLRGEFRGILNWALAGLRDVIENSWDLMEPDTIQAAKEAYFTEMADGTFHHWKDDIQNYIEGFHHTQPFSERGALRSNPNAWLSVDNIFTNILKVQNPNDKDKGRLAALMHSMGFTTRPIWNASINRNERVYLPEGDGGNSSDHLCELVLEAVNLVTTVGPDRHRYLDADKRPIPDVRLALLHLMASSLSDSRITFLRQKAERVCKDYRALLPTAEPDPI